MTAPIVTRTPDGAILLDTVGVDHWSAFVKTLTTDTVLRVRLANACRSGDPRLLAYVSFRLFETMAAPFQNLLTDQEAVDLAEELDAARLEPDDCASCGANPVDPEHDSLCTRCNAALLAAGL